MTSRDKKTDADSVPSGRVEAESRSTQAARPLVKHYLKLGILLAKGETQTAEEAAERGRRLDEYLNYLCDMQEEEEAEEGSDDSPRVG